MLSEAVNLSTVGRMERPWCFAVFFSIPVEIGHRDNLETDKMPYIKNIGLTLSWQAHLVGGSWENRNQSYAFKTFSQYCIPMLDVRLHNLEMTRCWEDFGFSILPTLVCDHMHIIIVIICPCLQPKTLIQGVVRRRMIYHQESIMALIS